MSDELNGQQNTVEENPQEAMPASIEKPVDDVVEEQSLPEDASDRTREQFEKLKQSNKEMAERLRQLEELKTKPQESALDSLVPKTTVPDANAYANLSQGDIDKQYESLVDANGYVDMSLLKKTLAEADRRAAEAASKANQALETLQRYTETDQTRRAHSKYPELDPQNPKFDQKFYHMVKNELIGQMMQGERDFVKAADTVAEFYKPNADKAQAEEQKQKEATVKEQQVRQINATGNSVGRQAAKSSDDEALKDVYLGKPGALAKLI